jgi:hypothetical protein
MAEFSYFEVLGKYGARLKRELVISSRKSPTKLSHSVDCHEFSDAKALAKVSGFVVNLNLKDEWARQRTADHIYLARYLEAEQCGIKIYTNP